MTGTQLFLPVIATTLKAPIAMDIPGDTTMRTPRPTVTGGQVVRPMTINISGKRAVAPGITQTHIEFVDSQIYITGIS